MKTLASKSKDEIISILTNYQNGEGGELGESYERFMREKEMSPNDLAGHLIASATGRGQPNAAQFVLSRITTKDINDAIYDALKFSKSTAIPMNLSFDGN